MQPERLTNYFDHRIMEIGVIGGAGQRVVPSQTHGVYEVTDLDFVV